MEAKNATLRKKRQITIPAETQELCNLHGGDSISLEMHPDGVLLQRSEDIVKQTAGAFSDYARNVPADIYRDVIWGEIALERNA